MKPLYIPIISNTYVSSKHPTKNFSKEHDLICENEASKHINIILFKFPVKDLKNIDICNIESVELCFHYNFLNTESINIFNNIEDYNPSTVIWYTTPYASKNSIKSCGIKNTDENLINFDITSLILALISSSKATYGVQIVPTANNSTLVLSSSRSDMQPFIKISFKKSYPKPSCDFNIDSSSINITADNDIDLSKKLQAKNNSFISAPDYFYTNYAEEKSSSSRYENNSLTDCYDKDCCEKDYINYDICHREIDFNPILVKSNDTIPISNFDININYNISLDCKNQQIILRTPGEYLVIWVLNCYPQSSNENPIICIKDCYNKTLGKSGISTCGGGQLTGTSTFSVNCTSIPYNIKLINKSTCPIEIIPAFNDKNTKYYFYGSITIVKLHC